MNLSLPRSFPIAKAALAAAVITCAFALACSLIGCASGGTDSSSADAGNTSASTDGKTLRVAMELAYPPFETKDDAGNPEGLAVDFIRDFGAAYGYDVQIENTAWDGLIPSLQSDKADLVISSMTTPTSASSPWTSPMPTPWPSWPFWRTQILAWPPSTT